MDSLQTAYSFVTSNWDTVAIATVVLALLTGLLAYFTWVLSREARKTRQQQLEPNIVVTVEPSELAMFYAFLIIENVGQGVAYDVSIRESEDHTFKDEKREFKLNDLAFMNLKVLKPGQKIEHLLGTFENLPSRTFQFDTIAKDAVGRKVKCSNTVDVNCYYDRRKFNEKTMDDLVNSLKKIEDHFGHLASGFRRLKVETYDKEEREEEQKQREEHLKQQREKKT